MDLSPRYSRPIIFGTSIVVAINLACTVWLYAMAFPPAGLTYAEGLTILLLLGLFLLHAGLAISWKGQRLAHFFMTIVVATGICGIGWIPTVIGRAWERWFRQSGEQEFTRVIDAVTNSRILLTGEHRKLNETNQHFQVWGQTNSDGTFSLFFYDKTIPRGPHGYLYYSGEWKEQKAGSQLFYLPDSSKLYSHYTNHWYRF